MMLAAPTAKPPVTRAAMNHQAVADAPAPSAESRNSTAVASSTERRPQRSATRPAKNAPTTQPSSIEPTSKPVAAAPVPKAAFRPSMLPLMTPLSKPNKKPPRVATQLIRTTSPRFSPGATGAAGSSAGLRTSGVFAAISGSPPASMPVPVGARPSPPRPVRLAVRRFQRARY